MPVSYAPSSNVAELHESATIAVSARAKALRAAGRPIIDLGAGEPDFPTPTFIREAAERAIERGATRYTEVEGIAPLREVIAARASARGACEFDATNVVVSTGSKQALFNACFTLFGAGDEVLVPTPGWTSYYEILTLARAAAVPVFGARANELRVTPRDLIAAATARTRGLVLNSPCNPTGAVYDAGELRALLDVAAERGWWVVSDEIYRRIAYDGEAPSLLDVARADDRVVVIDGVAKSHAMTGWRIGWSVAPARLTSAMRALQSHTTSNASTPAQHAVLAALADREAGDAAVGEMVAEFRRRRDGARELLAAAGADFIEPRGAFYLYVRAGARTPRDPEPGTALARELLEEHDVAMVPGAAFHTPEWIRMSYAAPIDRVLEGTRRLVALLERQRSRVGA